MGWRLGDGVVGKGLRRERSPLEKGVLTTEKEEKKNELNLDSKKEGNQGRSTPCELWNEPWQME
jgi:hypothetical protein